eukprot:CAMPEP_0117543786 /NCGR_PEP_ID=MMETSP0784-20121206/45239_1 /TAXON_ID=39447 /ORGANISM="" /LENGTH=805 /DNA_ID=CAMNT_0005340573 /DNA_START=107 /DNA_END=2524 /DNA_ORIENTATION=-
MTFFFQRFTRAIVGEGAVSLQAKWSDDELLVRGLISEASESYCSGSPDHDYWGDSTGDVRYEGHSCSPLCDAREAGLHCLSVQEVALQDKYSELFFVTHIQHQEFSSPESNASASEHEARNYFVPAVEAMPIEFSYTYTVPKLPWDLWDSDEHVGVGQLDAYTSTSDCFTMIFDSKDTHWKTFAPGEKITLTLGELLGVAGTSLDMIRQEAGPNFRGGVRVADGPPLRLSGGDIELRFKCYDSSQRRPFVDFDNPVCYVFPVLKGTPWVARRTNIALVGGGGARQARFNGIYLRTRVTAIHRRFDVSAIYLNAAAMVVFFRLPQAIMFVVTLWTLGHTSTIYRKYVYRDFSISAEAGSMAMRLVANAESFRLAAKERGCISIDAMRKEFVEIMSQRSSELNAKEVDRLVVFCLLSANESLKARSSNKLASFIDDQLDGITSITADMKDLLGVKKKDNTPSIPLGIDMQNFEAACSSHDPISFGNFVTLFDEDRRKGRLENFFFPAGLRESMDSATDALEKRGACEVNARVRDDSAEDAEDFFFPSALGGSMEGATEAQRRDAREVNARVTDDSAEDAEMNSTECAQDAASIAAPHADAPRTTHSESILEDMRSKMDVMEKRLSDVEHQLNGDKSCSWRRVPHIVDAGEVSVADLETRMFKLGEQTRLTLLSTMHQELASFDERLASGLLKMETRTEELEGRVTYLQHSVPYGSGPRRDQAYTPHVARALEQKRTVNTPAEGEQHPEVALEQEDVREWFAAMRRERHASERRRTNHRTAQSQESRARSDSSALTPRDVRWLSRETA